MMMRNNMGVELNKIFSELRSKSVQQQTNAGKTLHLLMIKHREYSEDIYYKLIELFKSSEKHEIQGALIALNKILKVIRDTPQIVHFVHRFLPFVFQQLSNSDIDIIEKSSDALGNLAQVGGTITTETIQTQVDTALAWLRQTEQTDFFGCKNCSFLLFLLYCSY